MTDAEKLERFRELAKLNRVAAALWEAEQLATSDFSEKNFFATKAFHYTKQAEEIEAILSE